MKIAFAVAVLALLAMPVVAQTAKGRATVVFDVRKGTKCQVFGENVAQKPGRWLGSDKVTMTGDFLSTRLVCQLADGRKVATSEHHALFRRGKVDSFTIREPKQGMDWYTFGMMIVGGRQYTFTGETRFELVK